MFSGAVCRADFLYPDEVTLHYTLPGVDSAAISCYTYPMSQSTRKGPIHTSITLNKSGSISAIGNRTPKKDAVR